MDQNAGSALTGNSADDVAAIDELREVWGKLRAELAKIIVGQDAVVEQLALRRPGLRKLAALPPQRGPERVVPCPQRRADGRDRPRQSGLYF